MDLQQNHTRRAIVSGAGGLVGRALSSFLQSRGWRVEALVRRPARPGQHEIEWQPNARRLDPGPFEGAAAIVHLAGENIAAGRWSTARKAAIRDSRVETTLLLARTIETMQRPPECFLCASAVGYYGNRGAERLTEASPAGNGFLAEVCRDWEAAAAVVRGSGVRTVSLRTGVVLAPDGGALAKLLPVFRSGLGGALGNGRQFMSWIARRDLVRVIEHVLTNPLLSGPVNAVAPQPVTNTEFTRTLARVLRRPAWFPLPAFAVRWLFGEMGEECLLAGQFVLPQKLLEAGFIFDLPNLEIALRSELAR